MSATSEQPTTSSPIAAIVSTLLVPGLSHLRAGEAMRGVLAFVTVVVPMLVGCAGLGQRFWFFAIYDTDDGASQGVMAIPGAVMHALGGVFPENFALGPSLLASLMFRGDGSPSFERLERMPLVGEEWFALLTTAAGLLAALWAADAAWLACGRRRSRHGATRPAAAAALAWLIPGGGHVWFGRATGDHGAAGRGVLAGGAIFVLFALGLLFSAGQGIDRGNHYVWWIGQSFAFVPLVIGAALSPFKLEELPAFYDLGVGLCTMAGLVNVLLIVDAYTLSETGPAPVDSAPIDPATVDAELRAETAAAAAAAGAVDGVAAAEPTGGAD
jgi:hypothetical protein